MRRLSIFVLFALTSTWTLACSPKKLEEPDAGKPAKAKKKSRVNPFAAMTPIQVGKHAKAATHVGWSPDGKWLVSTGKDNLVKVWDVAARKETKSFAGHTKAVMMADFSPDGSQLVSASFDETARLWDLARGKALAVLKEKRAKRKLSEEEEEALAALPPPQVNWAAFSPDGSQVITASDDFALKLWDAKSGKLVAKYADDGCRQRRVIRRRDAAGWISSAGCMADGVAYLKFWDAEGNQTGVFGAENKDAHYLAYDAQARFLVTADGSTFFNVYSAQGSFLKQIMVGTYHFCLAFGLGDETLLVGTDGGLIYVFAVDGWKRVGKLDLGARVAIDAMALHPDNGSLAVAARDGRILLFEKPVRLPSK
jgi:WD40 repeat protein